MATENEGRLTDHSRVFTGKRKNPRKSRALNVKLVGDLDARYTARTVDVSRGGMLVEVTDPTFMPALEGTDLLPFAARVASVFPHGMTVLFGDGAVSIHADVVRLVTRTGVKTLLLGCHFTPELTDFDCRLIGVDPKGDETGGKESPEDRPAARGSVPAPNPEPLTLAPESAVDPNATPPRPAPAFIQAPDPTPASPPVASLAPAASASPPAPRAPRPLSARIAGDGVIVAHLFPTGGPLFGPRYVARVAEVEGKRLVFDLALPEDEDDPVAYAAGLGAFVRAVVMRDGRVLWEARLAVDRLGEGADPRWARVEAEAAASPPPLARAAFESAFARA